MQQALLVHTRQCLCECRPQGCGEFGGQRAVCVDLTPQVRAFDVLGGEPGPLRLRIGVHERGDARAPHRLEDLDLLREPLPSLGVHH